MDQIGWETSRDNLIQISCPHQFAKSCGRMARQCYPQGCVPAKKFQSCKKVSNNERFKLCVVWIEIVFKETIHKSPFTTSLPQRQEWLFYSIEPGQQNELDNQVEGEKIFKFWHLIIRTVCFHKFFTDGQRSQTFCTLSCSASSARSSPSKGTPACCNSVTLSLSV